MRSLTVSKLYQPRRRGAAKVPHLRLIGRWLEHADFTAGSRVTVETAHGHLVLKKV